jgi:hypothetical protein
MSRNNSNSRSSSVRGPNSGSGSALKGEKELAKLISLLGKLGLSVDDAIEAVVSRVGPPGASGVLSNWKKLKHFNYSGPSSQVIENVFKQADFMCEKCGTQLRLSVDHMDRDATNHNELNLALKCMPCNQGFKHRKTALTLAAIELFDMLGAFPTKAQILERAGQKNIGSYRFYVMEYLRLRLEEDARTKNVSRLVGDFRKMDERRSSVDDMRKVDLVLEIALEAERAAGKDVIAQAFDRPRPLIEHVERLANLALGKDAVVLEHSAGAGLDYYACPN